MTTTKKTTKPRTRKPKSAPITREPVAESIVTPSHQPTAPITARPDPSRFVAHILTLVCVAMIGIIAYQALTKPSSPAPSPDTDPVVDIEIDPAIRDTAKQFARDYLRGLSEVYAQSSTKSFPDPVDWVEHIKPAKEASFARASQPTVDLITRLNDDYDDARRKQFDASLAEGFRAASGAIK